MADRVIHARAAFMSYTSEGPYALVVSGRVFTADPRWRPGDDDQPIPVVVIPLADYERLAALCQCRPPRAGQDGYTCPRCEDAGAVPYLKASLAAAEARADKAEAQLPAMRKALGLIPDATPEQVAYHVECMARDVPRLNAEKVAQWERAERADVTVAKLTAEVAYLRAWKAWAGGMAHRLLAANPEPQPPDGCAP